MRSLSYGKSYLGSNCSSLQCDVATRVVCVAFPVVSQGNLGRIAPRPGLALCRGQSPYLRVLSISKHLKRLGACLGPNALRSSLMELARVKPFLW